MRWFESHPVYGYKNKADFSQGFTYANTGYVMNVETNSYGHRDPEFDKALLDDEKTMKILLIGDSFTFGYGINRSEHFGSHLEEHFRNESKSCLIMNSGVGGWGTLQAFQYAKDHFNEFKPDIIIYTFCGNDYDDDIKYTTDKSLTDREKGLYYFPFKVFIRDHSHLYRFLAEKFRNSIHRFALTSKLKTTNTNVKVDEQSASLIIEDQWPHILERIRKFYGEFSAYNPDGILIIQASAPWHQTTKIELNKINSGLDKKLIYLDLSNTTEHIRDDDRRMPHDGHWSPIIHEISAKELKQTIDLLIQHSEP